jgi:hypothetical protein
LLDFDDGIIGTGMSNVATGRFPARGSDPLRSAFLTTDFVGGGGGQYRLSPLSQLVAAAAAAAKAVSCNAAFELFPVFRRNR